MKTTKYFTIRDDLTHWVAQLSDPDGLIRLRARQELGLRGQAAVPFLVLSLSNPKEIVRWEGAKALQAIRDPSTAPVLVKALEDESINVRWAAADALIALHEAAVSPLLEALVKRFDSVWLRAGAHHVLHTLAKDGYLTKPALEVFKALENIAPSVRVPWAAAEALREMHQGSQ